MVRCAAASASSNRWHRIIKDLFTVAVDHGRERIKFLGGADVGDTGVTIPSVGLEKREQEMRRRRIGIDGKGASDFGFGAGRIPIQKPLCFSEMTARFGVIWIQSQRFTGGCFHRRVTFQRRHIFIRQPQPHFRDPGPGAREFWVLLERLLEKSERFAQFFFATFVREIESAQIKLVRFRVLRHAPWRSRAIFALSFSTIALVISSCTAKTPCSSRSKVSDQR